MIAVKDKNKDEDGWFHITTEELLALWNPEKDLVKQNNAFVFANVSYSNERTPLTVIPVLDDADDELVCLAFSTEH